MTTTFLQVYTVLNSLVLKVGRLFTSHQEIASVLRAELLCSQWSHHALDHATLLTLDPLSEVASLAI